MSINNIAYENEEEYWKNITYRCERKYEYLIDKLALKQSEDNMKRKQLMGDNNK